MKRICVFSFGILLLNVGCTHHATSKTTELSKPIRIVYNYSFVEHCEKIGIVKASSGFGGVAMQGVGRKEVRSKLVSQTNELGGNVLWVNNISSGISGAKGDGTAFKCQPEWLDKISTKDSMPIDE